MPITRELREAMTAVQGAIETLHAHLGHLSEADTRAVIEILSRNINRAVEMAEDVIGLASGRGGPETGRGVPETGHGVPVPAAVHRATRSLLRAKDEDELRSIVADTVEALGGRYLPAPAPDRDTFAVDVSLLDEAHGGVRHVEVRSETARTLLETHVPELLADARAVATALKVMRRLGSGTVRDRSTGLFTPESTEDMLRRLTDDDVVAVLHPSPPPVARDGEPPTRVTLGRIADVCTEQLRLTDLMGQLHDGFVVLALRDTTAAAAEAILARLRAAWVYGDASQQGLWAAIEPVREDGGIAAVRRAKDHLHR